MEPRKQANAAGSVADGRKAAIIDAMTRFMNQRSGIEFGNYGDVKAFRAEQRSIYNDLKQARVLLAAVKYNDGITADDIVKASEDAFGGRLTITMGCGPQGSREWLCDIGYTAGQYFVTEYRRAVCAVLASALWHHARKYLMPSGQPGKYPYHDLEVMLSASKQLYAHFRKEFGLTIADRWFS